MLQKLDRLKFLTLAGFAAPRDPDFQRAYGKKYGVRFFPPQLLFSVNNFVLVFSRSPDGNMSVHGIWSSELAGLSRSVNLVAPDYLPTPFELMFNSTPSVTNPKFHSPESRIYACTAYASSSIVF